jgi:N-acyl-L-homoserine lactone synthetase
MGYQSRLRGGKARDAFPELEPAQAKPSQRGRFLKGRLTDAVNIRMAPLWTTSRTLRATTLSVTNMHRYGELYTEFLRARKRVFIDAKEWDLPRTEGMEFDQYDTPLARSVVIHEFGEILAGIRLVPTTARCGCYTYMLRDAQRGLLDGIPPHVLYEDAPVAPHIWEATRLFLSPDLPAKRRALVQTGLLTEMSRTAVAEGATHVIGIVPAVFKRWMARLGMSALPIGPSMEIDGDRTQAAMMHVANYVMSEESKKPRAVH